MDLIKFLKTEKNSRKIFGKRELKIIEKQLWGINLTQSEKNRLSQDIRKKFEFINKVSRIENDFKLKKGEIIKDTLEDILEVIKEDKQFKNIKKVLLFGSHVKNEVTFRSDIDIAIEFDKILTQNV